MAWSAREQALGKADVRAEKAAFGEVRKGPQTGARRRRKSARERAGAECSRSARKRLFGLTSVRSVARVYPGPSMEREAPQAVRVPAAPFVCLGSTVGERSVVIHHQTDGTALGIAVLAAGIPTAQISPQRYVLGAVPVTMAGARWSIILYILSSVSSARFTAVVYGRCWESISPRAGWSCRS